MADAKHEELQLIQGDQLRVLCTVALRIETDGGVTEANWDTHGVSEGLTRLGVLEALG